MLMPISPSTGEGPYGAPGGTAHGFGPGGAVTQPTIPAAPHPILGQLAELLAQHSGGASGLLQLLPGQYNNGAHGNFDHIIRNADGTVPAPDLPPGTYTGAYAAQGLRTTNPAEAAQLWESRHPAQVKAGNVPGWVSKADGQQLSVPETLHNVINNHRAQGGLPAMHPDEIHSRVAKLAQEVLHSRNGRRSRLKERMLPPAAPPSAPSGAPSFNSY